MAMVVTTTSEKAKNRVNRPSASAIPARISVQVTIAQLTPAGSQSNGIGKPLLANQPGTPSAPAFITPAL
jgi:hypothetical protein